MFSSIFSYIFPSGRLISLYQNGVNITNSTNAWMVTKNVTLTVVDCCCPLPLRPLRLAMHCVALPPLIGASITHPNPITVGGTFHIIGQIFEIC